MSGVSCRPVPADPAHLADLEVRPFDPADGAAVTALLHRAYGGLAERGLNFTAATQDVATTQRRAAAGPTWVVWDADRPVATLTLSLPPARMLQELTPEAAAPRRAWLNQMGVDPSHRGRGLARHLRDVAFAHAAAEGIAAIGVDTAESAQDLLDLYGRWGFVRRDVIRWPGKTYPSAVLVRAVG